MKKTKLTFDLSDENRERLERKKSELGTTYGNTINNLLSTFCDIPSLVKTDLLSFIKIKAKILDTEIDTAGDYLVEKLKAQKNAYMDIGKYLNNGEAISLEDSKKKPTLTKYPLKDGVLICPDDWIVLNPAEACNMKYAGVIECRNSEDFGIEHFGKPIPHFLFFSNKKYGKEFDGAYTDRIDQLCAAVWPNFQIVLDNKVEAIYDPINRAQLLNCDAWRTAPTIGHFSIYEQGDPTFGPNYEPPLGARIIRTESTEA